MSGVTVSAQGELGVSGHGIGVHDELKEKMMFVEFTLGVFLEPIGRTVAWK